MAQMWLLTVALLSLVKAEWITEFDHMVIMDTDEKYTLYWTTLNSSECTEQFDLKADCVHIGLEVESFGWIGFGLSPNGQMPESDIIIGWIDDLGEAHLQSRYTSTQRSTPIFFADISDTITESEQNANVTRISFFRETFPCKTSDHDDAHNVRQVEIGTSRVIFAWNDNNPNCDDSEECTPANHQSNRGKEFINFLTGSTPQVEMPDDVEIFDMLNDNYNVAPLDTVNYCKYMRFDISDIDIVRHIIRVDPNIESSSEAYVHHIVVTHCESFNTVHLGLEDICSNIDTQALAANGTVCTSIIMEWASGRKAFYYPEHVGLELGGTATDRLEYVRFNWHYDNPSLSSDIVDSSGLRWYFTATLREDTAMILMNGFLPYNNRLFIPGGIISTTFGYCPAHCTAAAYPPTGINIISNAFHMHLKGIAGKVRHVRDGEEREPIDINKAYDNDFQEFVLLNEEIVVLPGDELILECTYDTTDEVMPIIGGPATWNEMCHNWMIAYPKQDLVRCSATPTEEMMQNFFDEAAEKGYWNGSFINDPNGYYDTTIKAAVDFYNEFLKEPNRLSSCGGSVEFTNQMFITPESKDGFKPYPESDLDVCAEEQDEDDKLEGWLIAVIVIASILVVALLVFLGFKCKRKKDADYAAMNENEMQKNTDYGATNVKD
eukprot:510327_1